MASSLRGFPVMAALISAAASVVFAPAVAKAAGQVYIGTQAGQQPGGTGQNFVTAKVWRWEGNTSWEDLTPYGFGTSQNPLAVAAVMDLVSFDSTIYAAVQSARGYGGSSGVGQVWRYDGTPGDWTQVGGNLDWSVMVLEDVGGYLYAGTTGFDSYGVS